MQNSLVIQLRTVKIDFNTTDVCLSTVITRKSTVMATADSYNERTIVIESESKLQRAKSTVRGNILMSMREKNSRASTLSNLLISR